jgi:signal transduction histidine kinase
MNVINISERVAPSAQWSDVPHGQHFVQFYDADHSLVESVGAYLADGLEASATVIAIATLAHRRAIEQHFTARGIDVAAARACGQLVELDAHDALRELLVDGQPDRQRFFATVGAVVATAAARGTRVLAFGEMVALLWERGEHAAALHLEQLWNELRERHVFSLFCAYPMRGFDSVGHGDRFAGVCREHSTLIPAESYSARRTSDERLLTICQLQQKATALEREVERRARLEKELERRVAELAANDRRKDEFLAMLAHELRNPLAPIHNIAEALARQDTGSATQRRMHEMLGRQVRQLARLLDDLLDVARVTRQKIELHVESLELMHVIATAIEMCRPLIDSRRQHLNVSLPEVPVRLRGDRARLVQVFGNLLNNAAKFTPEHGRITIAAERDGERIAVRVRDDGCGIAPEVLPTVFDLFSQAQRTLDRAEGGLGLGLTIARSIVLLHHGTIEASSDGPGRGAEFIVRLPVPKDGNADEAATRRQWAGSAAPKRILIVDDNRDAGDSLAMFLRLDGHDVTTVADGPSALEIVGLQSPELILLDLGLPGMNGFEVAQRIRAQHPTVRIAAITGYGQAEDRRRTRLAGFDQHFVKPVDPAALRELLAGL